MASSLIFQMRRGGELELNIQMTKAEPGGCSEGGWNETPEVVPEVAPEVSAWNGKGWQQAPAVQVPRC